MISLNPAIQLVLNASSLISFIPLTNNRIKDIMTLTVFEDRREGCFQANVYG